MRGHQSLYCWVIGAVSGVLAALAGVAPTGNRGVDVAVVTLCAAVIPAAAATAPWWVVAVACGIAAASAARPLLTVIALCGVAMAVVIGARRRNLPWVRALAALLAVQVFARLGSHVVFGFTALVACVTLFALVICGVIRRRRTGRRVAWAALALVGAFGLAALVGILVAGLSARAPLQEANRQSHAGLDALNRGDMVTASTHFAAAAESFRSADDDLSAMWAQPARLLPVVAQHRATAIELTSAAAQAMESAATALRAVDPSSLRVVDGTIDIAAVRALVGPFTELRTAITMLNGALDHADSPWLVAPLRRELGDLRVDLTHASTQADNALLAVQVAPDMLGGNGLRRYFIAFTTPAEARGLGGFMGNWAEMTIDQGRITMTRFGRTSDLNSGGPDPTARTVTGPADVLRRWGRFGLADAQGKAGHLVWSDLTMAPDFPTVAKLIAQLYPQSGGEAIDGAFSLDPQAIAGLMSITGPITVDGVAQPLTSKNAAQFILSDQYKIPEQADRVDLLQQIAQATVHALLSSTLPTPAEIARTFGPLAREGRLNAWSSRPAEEALLAQVGMAGAFPQLDGRDGVAVAVDNQGANKVDQFLDVVIDYSAVHHVGTAYTGTLKVTLTNNSPSSGLPEYVIGGPLELPLGTNRMFLTIYTALPMVSATLDGQPAGLETDHAFGWNVAAQLFNIAPGASRVFELQLAGNLTAATYAFVTREQPLTAPAHITASIGPGSPIPVD